MQLYQKREYNDCFSLVTSIQLFNYPAEETTEKPATVLTFLKHHHGVAQVVGLIPVCSTPCQISLGNKSTPNCFDCVNKYYIALTQKEHKKVLVRMVE